MPDQEPVDPYRSMLYPAGFGIDEPGVELNNSDVKRHPELREVLAQYYKDEAVVCNVVQEVNRLFQCYRTPIKPGRCHYAPSPTWRDEYLLDFAMQSPTRFVVRLHVFEGAPQHNTGKYLGFVALRPPYKVKDEGDEESGPMVGYRHVIEAEVCCPSHMLRPRYHLISTNASPPRLGVMPFRSSVFMAPRFDVERESTCVHLALSQALHLVMGRFGCKPVSQREFDWHLARSAKGEIAQGATLAQALAVLEQRCEAGGFIAGFSTGADRDEATKQRALRCLTDCLANGMPVIMMVSSGLRPVHPDHPAHDQGGAPGSPQEAGKEEPHEPHAALILGMHLLHSRHEVPDMMKTCAPAEGAACPFIREDRAELSGRFVGHDVLSGPFTEWTANALLDAALKVPVPAPDGGTRHGIFFLAVGPKNLRLGLKTVDDFSQLLLSMLLEVDVPRALLLAYLTAHGCQAAVPAASESWRRVIRLMTPREARSRLGKEAAWQPEGSDLDAPYCWGVELWSPAATRGAGHGPMLPAAVFLWNAAHKDEPSPPDLLMFWEDGQMVQRRFLNFQPPT